MGMKMSEAMMRNPWWRLDQGVAVVGYETKKMVLKGLVVNWNSQFGS